MVMPYAERHRWTDEQVQWVVEGFARYHDQGTRDSIAEVLATEFTEKFSVPMDGSKIYRTYCYHANPGKSRKQKEGVAPTIDELLDDGVVYIIKIPSQAQKGCYLYKYAKDDLECQQVIAGEVAANGGVKPAALAVYRKVEMDVESKITFRFPTTMNRKVTTEI